MNSTCRRRNATETIPQFRVRDLKRLPQEHPAWRRFIESPGAQILAAAVRKGQRFAAEHPAEFAALPDEADINDPDPKAGRHPALVFLAALGKSGPNIRLRAFPHKHHLNKSRLGARKGTLNNAQARQWNEEGRGVYVVINDGGDKKEEITECLALFVEWDDKPLAWQIRAWRDLRLPEPTLMVATGGKSVHCYWVLAERLPPAQWEPLQARLIAFCGADAACGDLNRVMRLPGYCYNNPDGTYGPPVTIIHQSSGLYTAAEIEACLPLELPTETPVASSATGQRGGYPRRTLADIEEALDKVPQRRAGENSYPQYRNLLWGLAHALVEIGRDPTEAIRWMERHSPSDSSGWNIPQVFESWDQYGGNPGYFWGIAKHHGYRSSTTTRAATSGPQQPQQQAAANNKEACQLTYSELVRAALEAIKDRRLDDEMQLRAETMARFRCSDSRLDAELFRQLQRDAVGLKGTAEPPRTIDIRKVQGLDWLVDGFVPAKDQVLLWGESGAGKTTAVVQMGFAVIDGTGFLDRATASKPGRVLFIASDSGAAPFQNTLLDAGLLDHPAFDPGPNQRAFVWACDPDQGMDSWNCSITNILRLCKFVEEEDISLVVIDSAKSVTSSADIDYTNNLAITAMLTFFKTVICRHSAVVWVSHDGTAKGAHAGAKAWREVPSMAHQIEKVYLDGGEANKGTHASPRMRLWNVRKDRLGNERDIRYQIGAGGLLECCQGVEVIKDCRRAILDVLTEAYRHGIESLTAKGIVEEARERHGYSHNTIKTNLSRMHRGLNPEVRRCSRPSGHWELAPRIKESLKGCLPQINQLSEIPSAGKGEEELTRVDRQLLTVDPELIDQLQSTPENAVPDSDSAELTDPALTPHTREGGHPPALLPVPLPTTPFPVGSGADAFGDFDDPEWGPLPTGMKVQP